MAQQFNGGPDLIGPSRFGLPTTDGPKEFRIVPKGGDGSPAPEGLQVIKAVPARDGGEYIIPMPGLLPPGLHLSLHPSGEFHLKSRDHGTVAKLDLRKLLGGLKLGNLDSAFSKLLTDPPDGERAVGSILPSDLAQLVHESKGMTDIPAERLAETLREVEIEDTRGLPRAIRWLRSEGLLRPGSLLLLRVGANERPLCFIDAGGQAPPGLPPGGLREGLPFSRTFKAALSQLERFGGIMVMFPEGKDLDNMAEEAGLGDFLRGLKAFADDPRLQALGPEMEAKLRGMGLERMFGESAAQLSARAPIRPPSDHIDGSTGSGGSQS